MSKYRHPTVVVGETASADVSKEMEKAADKLDAVKNSSGDAWESTKDGFAKAYRDLYDAHKDTVGKFE